LTTASLIRRNGVTDLSWSAQTRLASREPNRTPDRRHRTTMIQEIKERERKDYGEFGFSAGPPNWDVGLSPE
jgi:hypothetical protein